MLNKRWIRIGLYMVIAALFLGGLLITIRQNVIFQPDYVAPPTPQPTAPPTPAPSAKTTALPSPSPSPTPYEKPIPVKIYFPAYKLSADIHVVGIKDGAMDTLDSAADVAWLGVGPAPGEEGNAQLNGHVTLDGVAGTFMALRDKLKLGDEVVIEFIDGRIQSFSITLLETHGIDAFPAKFLELDVGGEPRITMITCQGDFDRDIGTSRSRVVAVAVPDP